jgi:cation diffusion facilitator CzcD-associated flavoprotein CzcO
VTQFDSSNASRSPAEPDFHTLIVGAGFSGIGAAIQLDKVGLGDYLIVEAGAEPGGTWYWNTYPGIAVDIPSFSYQFSFEQSADWSRTYAKGRELKAYAERCVDKYGLRHKIRFDTKVTAAVFDDESDCWRLDLGTGGQERSDSGKGTGGQERSDSLTARFLINASGVLPCRTCPTSTASTASRASPCTPRAGITSRT